MPHNIYFTPGPTQLFHSFEDHFRSALKKDIGSVSHRSALATQVIEETTERLKALLQVPEDYSLFFLNAANEAWDRIIQNLVIDSSHHFANGSFSKKFYDFACEHRMNSTLSSYGDGRPFESFKVPEQAELIGIAKNETSIGYTWTADEIQLVRTENKDKLLALDVVSASPAIAVDFSQVDTAYLSVQKAFGMPPGLGLWIVNPRCIEKAAKKAEVTSLGSYRSLPNLYKFASKYQTPETPNMMYIYVLGEIAKDLLDYGTTRMQNDIIYKATLLKKTIEDHPLLTHFVTSEKHRSPSTVVAHSEQSGRIIDALAKKGLILGKGYGPYKETHIRIANFPAHSREGVELLCDEISKLA